MGVTAQAGASLYLLTPQLRLQMTDKKAIRQQYRKKRLDLPAYRQQLASYAIAKKVLRRVSAIQQAEKIAFYIAQEGEIDLLPLMLYCLKQGRQCYLPVLGHSGENILSFAEWMPGLAMSRNKFGIAEPVVPTRHILNATDMDLIFMPLVAFDKNGNRLGMGGGYYDRTLAKSYDGGTGASSKKTFLVATGHNIQYIPHLPHDSWDIIPHITVTPGHFIRPRKMDN